jgi:hypothetical protein
MRRKLAAIRGDSSGVEFARPAPDLMDEDNMANADYKRMIYGHTVQMQTKVCACGEKRSPGSHQCRITEKRGASLRHADNLRTMEQVRKQFRKKNYQAPNQSIKESPVATCQHTISPQDHTLCGSEATRRDSHGHDLCERHWREHTQKHGAEYDAQGNLEGSWSEDDVTTFDKDDSE